MRVLMKLFSSLIFLLGMNIAFAQSTTPTTTTAPAATSNEASQELVKLLGSFTSMQANFVQNSFDAHGNLLQKSSGQMALQRPGKFRWNTTSPNKQLLIADGKNLWIYDADLQQATKQKLDPSKNTNPASLLSGSIDSLQQRFSVNRMPSSGAGEWFELKPTAKNDMFQWIRLHFENNILTEMSLSDNLGQQSTLTFSQVKTNGDLNSNLFQFKPPAGTDVFNQ